MGPFPAWTIRSGVATGCTRATKAEWSAWAAILRGTSRQSGLFGRRFWHTADGVRQSCKFSVLRYGEKHAKQLACKARRKAMEEVRHELVRRRIVYGS